jgi:hypothetical protein
MMNTSMSSIRSWSDALHALRAQAEGHRGSITLSPDTRDAITFPRTTGQDVLAISVVFDAAVRAHASSAVVQRWLAENDLIANESPWTLADTYVGNRSYWSTLTAVALDLDRVHAALPPVEVWDAAMSQLATERDSLRNAAGDTLITLFTAPTWADMVDRQFQLFCMLRGEEHVDHPVAPSVPRTCNADVLELARYWTEQIARVGCDPRHTHYRLAFAGWQTVLSDVIRFAKPGHPRDVYVHNVQFWAALVLLAQGDASEEQPAPWAFQVPPSDDDAELRNAAPVDHGLRVEFPDARTWDDAARMQRDFLSQLRGQDVLPGAGLVTRIPRTTHSDVRQLAAYWSRALRKVGEHHRADISYRHVVDRWRAAVADVDRIPLDADPDAAYARNRDFWTALMTIAIQVAVTDEAPSRWTLIKQATKHSVENLPDTLSSVANRVMDAGKRALAGALTKPLLYVGGGIAGVTLLYLLLRQRDRPQVVERVS